MSPTHSQIRIMKNITNQKNACCTYKRWIKCWTIYANTRIWILICWWIRWTVNTTCRYSGISRQCQSRRIVLTWTDRLSRYGISHYRSTIFTARWCCGRIIWGLWHCTGTKSTGRCSCCWTAWTKGWCICTNRRLCTVCCSLATTHKQLKLKDKKKKSIKFWFTKYSNCTLICKHTIKWI